MGYTEREKAEMSAGTEAGQAAADWFDRCSDELERIADDPDSVTPRQVGLLRSYAVQGAMVGFTNGLGPGVLQVDGEWLRVVDASGCPTFVRKSILQIANEIEEIVK